VPPRLHHPQLCPVIRLASSIGLSGSAEASTASSPCGGRRFTGICECSATCSGATLLKSRGERGQEPNASDRFEENLNPVGRLYYAASTMNCIPTSLSQEVGVALGAQAGEAKLREVITAGGFATVRRATDTPFNMILEARL
jgi:hypothetical protein